MVLLLYSPVTLNLSDHVLLHFDLGHLFILRWNSNLVSDDLLIVWGSYCLQKWNFFTSFNSAVPFPQWAHSGRDSFMIKTVWQLDWDEARNERWLMTEHRRKSYENIPRWLCLLVSCLLVLLPPGRIYLTFFIFSLLRMSIYMSDFSSMNSLLFIPPHGMYNHCLCGSKKGYHR